MKRCFFHEKNSIYLVEANGSLDSRCIDALAWMLEATPSENESFSGHFLGPRKEMITPWSTCAVEIAENMGVSGLARIEKFESLQHNHSSAGESCDPMTQMIYEGLDLDSLQSDFEPQEIISVKDIRSYNQKEGLALSEEEIVYLENYTKDIGRDLSDAELFGFAQINSEHCRHKIFNGQFVISGEAQDLSLFEHIKKTSKGSGARNLVSAYKDNVAFMGGPEVNLFIPGNERFYQFIKKDTVVSLKAETHNFPTTVEPFSGASTGSGGEIRDRMAGGKGSLPLAGSAVYMTSYPRLKNSLASHWESRFCERDWKFQSPLDILIKASNGASDFGNKFGQPLITGSLLTFEGNSSRAQYAYDRTIMLAGGIGYSTKENAIKSIPEKDELVVVLGGDNYRIGMAGSSVSSVDGGAVSTELELSAVQRPNPEMQKRVYNVIRSLVESEDNPIRLVHDHGAGGHMNCLAELVEDTGGVICVDDLPLGDPTLSIKEILSNESQERMGLIIPQKALSRLEQLCARERAPMYVVGRVSSDDKLKFVSEQSKDPVVDFPLDVLFGSTPKTVLNGDPQALDIQPVDCDFKDASELELAIQRVLSLEGVACKDWLTNKVDRSVTGLVAGQQCAGPLQLPINDVGVTAISYTGAQGIATAIGSAPVPALIDERAGSRLAIAEALTNLVWAKLEDGFKTVALSANWMWPAKRPGENSRLYRAVEAVGDFALALDIPVPTGKDSLSMTMNYDDGLEVRAPGTVVISASATCEDIHKTVSADLKSNLSSSLLYINLSSQLEDNLGGSSFAQTLGLIGDIAPDVEDATNFKTGFELIQSLVADGRVLAGHDVSAGGVVTTVLEMAFGGDLGCSLKVPESKSAKFLFTEKPAVVLQVQNDELDSLLKLFEEAGLEAFTLGAVGGNLFELELQTLKLSEYLAAFRDIWFRPSALLDAKQTGSGKAQERQAALSQSKLEFKFPDNFLEILESKGIDPLLVSNSSVQAAVVRDKGSNGEREMAFALHAAGFAVKDVTMHELTSGQEDLSDISFLVFPGGFTNSDVLGAAKGWAGSFLYNQKAMSALQGFLARPDTLSLGVCNGCQLMGLLDIVVDGKKDKINLAHNESGKFESNFVNLDVQDSSSIMLKPLVGSRLGAWVAHAEGRFECSGDGSSFDVPLRYTYSNYPANPNGSLENIAGVVSKNGRHLAMMPHIERSIRPWHWPYRPWLYQETNDLIEPASFSPWILAFSAAKEWIASQ